MSNCNIEKVGLRWIVNGDMTPPLIGPSKAAAQGTWESAENRALGACR